MMLDIAGWSDRALAGQLPPGIDLGQLSSKAPKTKASASVILAARVLLVSSTSTSSMVQFREFLPGLTLTLSHRPSAPP